VTAKGAEETAGVVVIAVVLLAEKLVERARPAGAVPTRAPKTEKFSSHSPHFFQIFFAGKHMGGYFPGICRKLRRLLLDREMTSSGSFAPNGRQHQPATQPCHHYRAGERGAAMSVIFSIIDLLYREYFKTSWGR
jgi:hypothetical protein